MARIGAFGVMMLGGCYVIFAASMAGNQTMAIVAATVGVQWLICGSLWHKMLDAREAEKAAYVREEERDALERELAAAQRELAIYKSLLPSLPRSK